MRRVPHRFPTRLDGSDLRTGQLAWWYGLSFLILLLLPVQLRLGGPFWALPVIQEVQVWVWGASFLALAVVIGTVGSRPGGIALGAALIAAAGCFGAAYGFLLFRSEVQHSRWIAVLSAFTGFILAVLPFVLRRRLAQGTIALGVGAVVVGLIGVRSANRRNAGPETVSINTVLYPVSLTYHPHLVDTNETEGGAIEPLGQGFLLVTGEGEFYHLEWEQGDSLLRSRRLPFTAPFDRAEFLADPESIRSQMKVRVTDLALDTATASPRMYLAHQYWNSKDRCFTLRVSVAALPEPTGRVAAPPEWETVFETRPCLPLAPTFEDSESGGELAWDKGGALLIAVGDHGFNGLTEAALAQEPDTDYGKVLRLDLAGGREVVSLGHRNPQGLVVDHEGRVWITEHGPQGGDEINLVEQGGNYGWPLATYGTQYGVAYWPLAKGKRDHGPFVEPVIAFVPSVAIASIIEVGARRFPDWQGDFLAGSLRAMTLYRIRTRNGRVSYVETIAVRRRIRDLTQGSDGRIVLWTDQGDIVVLALVAGRPDGQLVYGRCSGCHGANLEGSGLGPPLRGIVGRRVASREDFSYSPGLSRRGGLWTVARLDTFLLNPEGFASGTRMKFPGIPDERERRELIEFLRGKR
ncbi:MAG TPA: PQQ-dependent sugar dehydrogenase [Gemmatimonadales bacterium]